MQKRETLNSTFIWLTLIVSIIFFFPKACGTIPPSEVLDCNCMGIDLPYNSHSQLTNSSVIWCSGICIEKSIVEVQNVTATEVDNSPPEVAGIKETVSKALPKLMLIFIIIGLVSAIIGLKKKKTTTEVNVVRVT